MKVFRIFSIIILILFITGCGKITKEEAESNALKFVNEKVKFFARDENTMQDLPKYSISGVTSYLEDKNWVVILHASANLENETKDNDLTVKVNNKGEIIEFNGKEIPQEAR